MENYYGGPKGLQGIQGEQGEQGEDIKIVGIFEDSEQENLNDITNDLFIPSTELPAYEENKWFIYIFTKLNKINYGYSKDYENNIHKIFLGYKFSGLWEDTLDCEKELEINFNNFIVKDNVYYYPYTQVYDLVQERISSIIENEKEKWNCNFELLLPSPSGNEISINDYSSELSNENQISEKIEGEGYISKLSMFFTETPIIITNFYLTTFYENKLIKEIDDLGFKLTSWDPKWQKIDGFYSLAMMKGLNKTSITIEDQGANKEIEVLVLKNVEDGIYKLKGEFSFYTEQSGIQIGFQYTDNTADLYQLLDEKDFNFLSDINKNVKAIIFVCQNYDGYFQILQNIKLYKMVQIQPELLKFSNLEESTQGNGNINFNFNPSNLTMGHDALELSYTKNNQIKKFLIPGSQSYNNLVYESFCRPDTIGDYCFNVFNKKINGWSNIGMFPDSMVYGYEKIKNDEQGAIDEKDIITFTIKPSTLEGSWSIIPGLTGDAVREEYTVFAGATLENIQSQSTILSLMEVDEAGLYTKKVYNYSELETRIYSIVYDGQDCGPATIITTPNQIFYLSYERQVGP